MLARTLRTRTALLRKVWAYVSHTDTVYASHSILRILKGFEVEAKLPESPGAYSS